MADVSMNIGASPVSLEISDALGPIEMDINPIGLSNSTIGLTLPGPKGEKGDVGAGLNIYGSYPSYEALVAAHPTADPGEAYLIDGHLFVWGKVDNEWIDVGDIQGPQGDPGLDGYSPVKGTDYWTDEDKADVIAEVMSNSEAVFQPLTDSLTEETDLADGDAFPFHDASVDAPRKSLWSNIKSKLKSYFDTLYAALAHSHALDDDDEITGVLPLSKGGTGAGAANRVEAMNGLATICLMENPISEAVPYNATTPRVAMFAWQDIIQTPSGYEILKNYDGTRNVGVIIPHDGFYRVHLDVLLSKESSSSAMRLRILQMPSTWALPTGRNYLLESDYSASEIRKITRLEKAWTGTTTMGAAVGVIYCNAGDKIVPTVTCDDTSKDISSRTVFSIQNIG